MQDLKMSGELTLLSEIWMDSNLLMLLITGINRNGVGLQSTKTILLYVKETRLIRKTNKI